MTKLCSFFSLESYVKSNCCDKKYFNYCIYSRQTCVSKHAFKQNKRILITPTCCSEFWIKRLLHACSSATKYIGFSFYGEHCGSSGTSEYYSHVQGRWISTAEINVETRGRPSDKPQQTSQRYVRSCQVFSSYLPLFVMWTNFQFTLYTWHIGNPFLRDSLDILRPFQLL